MEPEDGVDDEPQHLACREASTSVDPPPPQEMMTEEGEGEEESEEEYDTGRASAETEAVEMEEEIKKRPGLSCYVRWVANFPKLSFALIFCIHTYFMGVTIMLAKENLMDIFPYYFDNLPVQLRDGPWMKRSEAWWRRKDYKDRRARGKYFAKPSSRYGFFDRVATEKEILVFLVYDAGEQNIFTKARLQKMKIIEEALMGTKELEHHCRLQKPWDPKTGSAPCFWPTSVLRFFDGTYGHVDSVFKDSNFDNVEKVLYAAYAHEETRKTFLHGVAKRHLITPKSVTSTATRAVLQLGMPIRGVKNVRKKQYEFMQKHLQPVLDSFLGKFYEYFDFSYYHEELMIRDVKMQVFQDLKLAIGSLTFIFFYILFHTRTFWVTCLAAYSILCSFVETNLVYRYVLGYKYFGYFHILALFIILGIGADDLFVFWDAWIATGCRKHPNLAYRLNEAYRDSVVAMFVTSVTTAIAFLSNATSPLLATNSFGVFAAVLVGIDYLSVITFFPPIVIMYHVYFESLWQRKRDLRRGETVAVDKPGYMVVFFRDHYFYFVTHHVIRWLLIGVGLSLVIFFAYQCSLIESDKERVQLWKDDHHYTKAFRLFYGGFLPADTDETIELTLMWGLQEASLDHCHFSDVHCKGKGRFDEAFNPNTPEAQLAFQKLCDDLYAFKDHDRVKYKIKKDFTTQKIDIACFTTAMNSYLENSPVPRSVEVGIPWNYTQTLAFMQALAIYFSPSKIDENFTHYLQIPITYWLADGFRFRDFKAFDRYDDLIGEQWTKYTHSIRPHFKNWLAGTKIMYIFVAIGTTLNPMMIGPEEGVPVITLWEKFMQDRLQTMPKELQSGMQISRSWHWVMIQKAMADNAKFGVVLGVSLALPILILSTKNLVNGFLANFSIACTTVCVIGLIPPMGWRLGVLVSLNMCLVVGLAVDFVAHLAEGYHLSAEPDRLGRVRDTLSRMGVSIVSGACTTLGASSFLLAAKIKFFYQFGVFMFFSIGFSLVLSMGLYIPLMGLLGPERDQGDWRSMLPCCKAASTLPARKARKRGRGRARDDEAEDLDVERREEESGQY